MYRPKIVASIYNGQWGALYILILHGVSQFARLPRKPSITVALIMINILVFLRAGRLDDLLPSLFDACLNPFLILKDWDAKRLILSAFYHVDETHLVYNMLSLLWKGALLETQVGSCNFARMVAILLALSHGMVVLVAKILLVLANYPLPFFSHCTVGFSSVLFALKVVLNWDSLVYTIVCGLMIPARHMAWVELLIIEMLVPKASFLGHLCGILAGLLYLHLLERFNGSQLCSTLYGRFTHSTCFLLRPLQIFMGWTRYLISTILTELY